MRAYRGLIAPFAATVDHDFAYYVVYPKTATTPPNIAAFRDWLVGEAAGDAVGHAAS